MKLKTISSQCIKCLEGRHSFMKGNEFEGGRMRLQCDRGTISCLEWRHRAPIPSKLQVTPTLMEDTEVITFLHHGMGSSFWNQAGVLISSAKLLWRDPFFLALRVILQERMCQQQRESQMRSLVKQQEKSTNASAWLYSIPSPLTCVPEDWWAN